MKVLPYHHLLDGTFRNPEGSPLRDPNIKWSMLKWNKEKRKSELIYHQITLLIKRKC